jgi:hypothetical protein
MKQIFKSVKEKIEQQQQAEQQLKEQELQQQNQQFQYQQKQAEIKDQEDKEFEAEQNELDRINAKEVALINASKAKAGDQGSSPDNTEANALAMNKLEQDASHKEREYLMKQMQLQQKNKENDDYVALELKKIGVERERLQAQITMKKMDVAKKKAEAKKKKT